MFSFEQYHAVRQGSGFLDRSARGRLRLTGRDRRDYLQGLLTNDIAALTPGTGCYAALLTAQGRMISDMYVLETGEAVLMDVEPALTARVFAHLERFIFSEDVQVADETASRSQITVCGPAASAVLGGVLREGASAPVDLGAMNVLDNRAMHWRGGDVVVVRRDDIGTAGYDVLIDAALAPAVIDALRAAGAHEIDDDVAEAIRVEGGQPRFGQDMDEDTIPLEAGIEDRAISMTKGCYVGQEIIVRVLHRGHGRVARRLVGITLEGETVPQRGAGIRSGERAIGSVTSAVWSPAAGAPLALGYVHRDFAGEGTAVSVDYDGQAIGAVVSPLPVAAKAAAADPHPPAR
jgi:folate-binding protein YgfZ